MRTTARGDHDAVTCGVWWATPADSAALSPLLDDSERRRAARLQRSGDRDQFVTARALLRLLLSERTGTPPADHRVDTTCHRCGAAHSKPRLVGEDVSFSIAHSDNLVAVALADTGGTDIGLDVEPVGGHGAAQPAILSTHILGRAELADYQQLDSRARARALAVWWTRKESVLKATGAGLTVSMRDVAVTAPDEPAALRGTPGRQTVALAALRDLTPDANHVACVAALRTTSLVVVVRDGDELLAGAAATTTRTIRP